MSTVLAVLERAGDALHRMSFEALAAAQQLASQAGLTVTAVLPGADDATLSAAAEADVVKVLNIRHELMQQYTADAWTEALTQLIRATQPRYVVLPHTYQVRDFAPRVATRFNQVLVSDAVEIGPDKFVRQMFQGKLNAEVSVRGEGPAFVSTQAGAFRADSLKRGAAPAPVEEFTPELDAGSIRTKPGEPFREAVGALDLTSAERIVAVGRGIREQEHIALVEEMAGAMGAELAASRPICDNGWLPMERQVGSSGQTVSPKLYVAVGISGAIQHLVGMKGARTVVAINKDPEAPIFEIADYGIAADLFDVVPALTEALRKG